MAQAACRGGANRQICRFPDGGRERPWRCQLATPRCKARLAAPVITLGKFAEGQPLAPPEGKSCQLARFRWWSAVSPVAMACPRDANLHLCACCLKSANWRICCHGQLRVVIQQKGANLRNYSGRRVIIVRTLVGNPCIRKPVHQLEIKVKIAYST